jgi:hypothetical protein
MGNGMEDLEVAIPFPTAVEMDEGKDKRRVGRRDGVLLRGLKPMLVPTMLVVASMDMMVMRVNVGTMTR